MTIYRFNEFTFDSQTLSIEGPAGRSELRNQVRQLFELLLNVHPGVVSHETIMAEVWPDTHVKETAVAQLVLELRQALEQAGCERSAVNTVPRKGYRWTVPYAIGQQQASHATPRWLWPVLPVALVLAFWLWPRPEKVDDRKAGMTHIAMMPFHNDTGNPDLAWFELGFPDVIGQILDSDDALNTVPIADVLRQVDELKLDLNEGDAQQTLLRALGVDLMIQTTISQQADGFVLDFSFIQPNKPRDTWQTQVSRPWDVVPALASGIRQRISMNLVLPTDDEDMILDAFTTQAYANGVQLLNLKDFAKARPYFEVVTDRAPDHLKAKFYIAQCALKMADYDTCRAICEQLTSSSNAIPGELQRSAQHLLAELHFNLRDYAQSQSVAEALTTNLNADQDPDWAVKVYWLMGSIHLAQGQDQQAETWYLKALALSREHRMLAAEAASLWYLAGVNTFNQANLPYLRDALDIASALGNNLLRAKLLNAIALLLQSQDKHQEARELFEEALAVRRDLQDKRGIGLGLLYLGNCESRFDPTQARIYFQQCIDLFQEIQDAWNTINTYIYLSHLENIEGQFDASIDQLDRAMDIAREANDQDAFFYITFNKVATELRRKDVNKARHYIAQIRAEGELPDHKASGAWALEALCDYAEGSYDQAMQKMTLAKSTAGDAWHQGFQRYYTILVQAQVKREDVPLPIDTDPAKWLFD